jgi:hypothetical protein
MRWLMTQSDWVPSHNWVPVRLGTQSDWVTSRTGTQSDWVPSPTGTQSTGTGAYLEMKFQQQTLTKQMEAPIIASVCMTSRIFYL